MKSFVLGFLKLIKTYYLYVLIALIVVVPASYYLYHVYEDYKFNNYVNTFSFDNEEGVVYIRGYIDTVQLPLDEGPDPKNFYDYLVFRVVETKSEDFKRYLDVHSGNSFIEPDWIGLGCLEGNKIKYYSIKEQLEEQLHYLNKKDTKYIKKSSKRRPRVIKLTFNGKKLGKCAVDCYTHALEIEVIR